MTIRTGLRTGASSAPDQTVARRLQGLGGDPNGAAHAGGFSLHAGLALMESGQVCYTLKTPYRDGTTRIVLALHSRLR